MAKKDGTVDLRIQRTQKSIKQAFFELIEEEGFDHISVKDITARAMISRNTFYLHYSDKFDLLNKICDEIVFKLFLGVGKQLRRETRKLRVDTYGAAIVIKWELKLLRKTGRLTEYCSQVQALICSPKSFSRQFAVRLTLSKAILIQ